MKDVVIVYNPKRGSSIRNFRWNNASWSLDKNKMAKFPIEIAEELLKRFGFLRRVKPEEILQVEEEMKAKQFVCEHCNAEFSQKKQLDMHKRAKHKLSKDVEAKLLSIPSAEGVKSGKTLEDKNVSPEGIPHDESDGWYGPGEEEDLPESMATVRPGSPGVFGA